MAGEITHASVGIQLDSVEWVDAVTHILADASITSRKVKQNYSGADIDTTATPNAQADITGATLICTPEVVSIVRIEFSAQIQNNTDTDRAIVYILRDGVIKKLVDTAFHALGIGQPHVAVFYDAPVSAAAHTYKLQWVNTHAGDQLRLKGELYCTWWAI